MASRVRSALTVLKKISKAALFFAVFGMAIPLILGIIYGIPSGSILSLIVSTFLLQAAAPSLGWALGLSTPAILVIMASFAAGIVIAILEVCESLAMTSARVERWIGSVGKKMEKYPAIKKYGAVSCILIAWIPGIGLYGTPIIAWILGWRRLPTIIFTTLGFVIASVFVLFFMSVVSMELIVLLVAAGVVCFLVLVGVRKFVIGKR